MSLQASLAAHDKAVGVTFHTKNTARAQSSFITEIHPCTDRSSAMAGSE
jgi:hypothetical protein